MEPFVYENIFELKVHLDFLFLYLYFEILSKALSFVIIFRSKVNTQYADRLVDNLMMTLYDNILGLVLFFCYEHQYARHSLFYFVISPFINNTFFPIIQCLWIIFPPHSAHVFSALNLCSKNSYNLFYPFFHKQHFVSWVCKFVGVGHKMQFVVYNIHEI